jgi:hypothetical protein
MRVGSHDQGWGGQRRSSVAVYILGLVFSRGVRAWGSGFKV